MIKYRCKIHWDGDTVSLYDDFKVLKHGYYYENNMDDFKISKDNILSFFLNGEKESVVEFIDQMDNLRTTHSMALLYLGIMINQKMNLNINVQMLDKKFEFNYLWSILCFTHDVGYIAENDLTFKMRMKEKYRKEKCWNYKYYINRFNRICRDFCLSNSLPSNYIRSINRFKINYGVINKHCFDNVINKSFDLNEEDLEKLNNIKGVNVNFLNKKIHIEKSFFSKKEIMNYYEYRLKEFRVYDHGIVGGYIFYDVMCKSYCRSFLTKDEGTIFSFSKNNRYFIIEQLPLFAYIADCIVSHNVFFSDSSSIDNYNKYEIKSIDSKKGISISENPLLFLLELVDTIDPIKYFLKTNISVDEILKSFDWIIDETVISIVLVDNSYISLDNYKAYAKMILDIKDWLKVEADFANEVIKIKILMN
jgi:hypothetical protein